MAKFTFDRILPAAILFAFGLAYPVCDATAADESEFAALDKTYTVEIRPLVVKY